MIKAVLLSLALVFTILKADSKIYFLPKDADVAKEQIIEMLKKADKKIDLAMYNLSYKSFINELIDASKRGVKINLFLEKEKAEKNDKINDELLKNGIKYKFLDSKNHLKLLMVDEEKTIFGSANYTKESFKENYEILYFSDKKKDIKQIKKIFEALEKNY